jgi:hypothetical protein
MKNEIMTKEEQTNWMSENEVNVQLLLMREINVPLNSIEFTAGDRNFGTVVGNWGNERVATATVNLNDLENINFMIDEAPKWSTVFRLHQNEIETVIADAKPFDEYDVLESTNFNVSAREDKPEPRGTITYTCSYDGVRWNLTVIGKN